MSEDNSFRRTLFLVLQPTTFCNIDCKYCYLPYRSKRVAMTDEVLRGVSRNILASPFVRNSITVCWHSGEPLVLPVSYYKNAITQLESHKPERLKLHHLFQTNGLLVTNEWASFLATLNAQVGISIDGPAAIHDQMRVTRNGEGTHSRVMRGLTVLRSAGLNPNVICVLTRESIEYPDIIFEFFESHGFNRVAFNFEEMIGSHNKIDYDHETQSLVELFLSRYISLIRDNHSSQSVRDIEQIAYPLFSVEAPGRGRYASVCEAFGHISVDVNGNFWTFSPELGHGHDATDFFLGNCRFDGLETVALSQRFQDIRQAVDRGIEICRAECAYFSVCGGGSPAHKLVATGRLDAGETWSCRLAVKAPTNVLTALLLENGQHGSENTADNG